MIWVDLDLSNIRVKASDGNTFKDYRELNLNEVDILKNILIADRCVHNLRCCFCDDKDNLYSLKFDRTFDKTHIFIDVVFVKSRVTKLHSSKPLGFYEPCYPVYETLDILYNNIPKI
jgi:hypothetical protein